MVYMNRYDIQNAVNRLPASSVAGRAARILQHFQEEVDAHSDGWPYWSVPVHAARKLQELVEAHHWSRVSIGAGKPRPDATEAELRKALAPVKAFMTRKGHAAGLQMLELD